MTSPARGELARPRVRRPGVDPGARSTVRRRCVPTGRSDETDSNPVQHRGGRKPSGTRAGPLDPHYVVTVSAEPVNPPPPAPALVIEGHPPGWQQRGFQLAWAGQPGTTDGGRRLPMPDDVRFDWLCPATAVLTSMFPPTTGSMTFSSTASAPAFISRASTPSVRTSRSTMDCVRIEHARVPVGE